MAGRKSLQEQLCFSVPALFVRITILFMSFPVKVSDWSTAIFEDNAW